MTEYFALVFAVSFTAALGGALLYGEGDNASRTAISIILLLAVLSPLPMLVSQSPELSLPDLSGGVTDKDAEYLNVARGAFEDGIAEMLSEKYSLSKESFAVKLDGFDFAEMKAERITVTLRMSAAMCDPLAVEKYINSFGIGECHAEIGI